MSSELTVCYDTQKLALPISTPVAKILVTKTLYTRLNFDKLETRVN
ncbi:MAG: hypothetical protein ACK5QF_07530 [Dolichospermum sp.]|jgi:hypothetical protein